MKFLKKIRKGIAIFQGKDDLYYKMFNHSVIDREKIIKNGFQQIEVKNEPNPELRRIFQGIEKLDFVDVYVHGSWADDTKTPFSDLDDLIIINREKLLDDPQKIRKIIKWLAKVELRFYRKDVLQHHGHWIVFKDSLECVDESYIPINVVQGGVLIKGNPTLNYKPDSLKTLSGLKRNVEITKENIFRLMNNYWAGKINSYEMKALIGSFLLMPAYLFQVNGKVITKRYAIERKGELFSPEVCQLIDKCSTIRLEWGKALRGYKFFLLKVLAYILPHPFLFRYVNKKISPKFPVYKFPVITKKEIELYKNEIEQLCQ